VDYEEVDVDVDRGGDAGDYWCMFTATAPRTRFEFNPRFEFNRAAQLRAAQIALRKSRRANRAAQIAPRNCRRAIRAAQPRLHTAPIP
jgi:hypothetical protein